LKILLAEDSGLIRKVLERALTARGHEVVLAEDGEQAWRVLAAADPPPIALLDWMMPGLDGLEVCKRVREARREPYVYIILLTGKEEEADVARGLAAGADDYLKKPFDSAELEARIETGRRLVEQRSRR
jgi:two-component system, cell cycle response regulator